MGINVVGVSNLYQQHRARYRRLYQCPELCRPVGFVKKYIEQWLFWIAVDAVCAYLYIGKGIPFKASLYALYVVIAVMGYFKWKRMMQQQSQPA